MANNEQITPKEHVAKRINMYRIRQHMTIDTLSKKVHISPSTLSKYEHAKLSINIATLFEIADALQVSVTQLVDYQKVPPQSNARSQGTHFFNRSNIFYLYQYFAPEKKIYLCVMEVVDTPHKDQNDIILYYDVSDISNYTNSEYIYKGIIRCYDQVTNIYCRNPYNASDELSICAKSTFSTRDTTTGLLLAVSQSLRNPYATKIIFALNPLPMNDKLRVELSLSDKNILSELKRINALIVY